jgi:hypothetical protein
MRYEPRKLKMAWVVWDNEAQAITIVDGKPASGLAELSAIRLADELNQSARFLIRKGIEGWMVWDRIARRPASLSGRPYTGLTEEDAKIIRDGLNFAAENSKNETNQDEPGS